MCAADPGHPERHSWEAHYVGDGCVPGHENDSSFAREQGYRLREDDQRLPQAARGPVMHDLLTADLKAQYGWHPALGLVVADVGERKQLGIRRYGQPLRAYNGRDALLDAYQEGIDMAVYLLQAVQECGPRDMVVRDSLSSLYGRVALSLLVLRELMVSRDDDDSN